MHAVYAARDGLARPSPVVYTSVPHSWTSQHRLAAPPHPQRQQQPAAEGILQASATEPIVQATIQRASPPSTSSARRWTPGALVEFEYLTREGLRRLGQLERAVAHATACHWCDTTTRHVSVCQGRREAEGSAGRMGELHECAAESSKPSRRFERSDLLRHCSAALMPISAQTARRRWLLGSLRGVKPPLTHQCPTG